MFITVKYGDNSRLLLNPNCSTKNLLDYVKFHCQCEKGANLDLCDETGNLKYLNEQEGMDKATVCLQSKATYIPIVIEKNADESIKDFVPLLNEIETEYPELLNCLWKRHLPAGNMTKKPPTGKESSMRSNKGKRGELLSANDSDRAASPSSRQRITSRKR